MPDLSLVVLPLVASATHAIGFLKYNSQTTAGTSRPNFASWFIWALLSALNALSFMAITSLVAAAQTFVGAAGCTGTFVHALVAGKFEKPTVRELVVLGISVAAIAVWKFDSALHANLVLLSAIALSFWPSIEGVWREPAKEKPLPWILWGVAYGLTTVNTFALVGLSAKLWMPFVGTVAHLAVPVVCACRKR